MNKFLKLVLLSSMMLPGVVAMEPIRDPVVQAQSEKAQIVQKFSGCNDCCKFKFTEEGKIAKFEYFKNVDAVGDESMNYLLKFDLSELEGLNFFGTKISSDTAKALAEAIKMGRTPKLYFLDLSYCDINYDGTEAIINAVIEAANNNLFDRMSVLGLCENDLTGEQEYYLDKKLKIAVKKNPEKFDPILFGEIFGEYGIFEENEENDPENFVDFAI